jgi:hypothetical protein
MTVVGLAVSMAYVMVVRLEILLAVLKIEWKEQLKGYWTVDKTVVLKVALSVPTSEKKKVAKLVA